MNLKKIYILSIMLFFSVVGLYGASGSDMLYPLPLSDYPAEADMTLWQTLKSRVALDNFNLVALIIFVLAILHTFSYRQFVEISHKLEARHLRKLKEGRSGRFFKSKSPVSFWATIFHFLGEIEVVFAIWLVPLFFSLIAFHGTDALYAYLDNLAFVEKKFVEPVFVIIVMAISSTRPVIEFSEKLIGLVAKLGKQSVAAWWCSILIVGPILGSFITEPAAITISALLINKKVFSYKPSLFLKYTTLSVLLVCISTGGTLTHFAAPPVLMVANKWGWDFSFMFMHFGIRAVIGILITVSLGYLILRKEFNKLKTQHMYLKEDDIKRDSKYSIMFAHLFFLAYSVVVLHHIVLLIMGFLAFIAFVKATRYYQDEISLKMPVLVGLFLAGLVIHGGLQAWWIEPVLTSLSKSQLFVGSIILTAFNDNAAITYLASLVPNFSEELKFLVVAGAVTGGGLTVIANAPNPAGVSILSSEFKNGVSPISLLKYSAIPTLIMAICFIV